eukprot:TRINITY_DN2063_c0_g1_i1.p1 TRINITY_DN2063_c0_g1~~TRINITY_DN2063_c0_g1_i1.p1  ORF type:complete len:494 (+),score=69.21 TRINITY_DN2063_c0_g1_i1:2-1483(+)
MNQVVTAPAPPAPAPAAAGGGGGAEAAAAAEGPRCAQDVMELAKQSLLRQHPPHNLSEYSVQKVNNHNTAAGCSVKPPHTRNVLFVGRSRAGKSTIVSCLQNPFQWGDVPSLYHQTRDPCMHSVSVSRQSTDGASLDTQGYLVNFIDTPGLFERTPKSDLGQEPDSAGNLAVGQRRQNKTLRQLICTFLKDAVPDVHLVCFVVSFEAGVSSDDLHAISEMLEEFDRTKYQLCLLVTRCERKLPIQRKNLERQIQAVPELRQAFGVTQGDQSDQDGVSFPKILFIGSVSHEDVERGDVSAVQRSLSNILGLRSAILDYILDECNQPFSVEHLAKDKHATSNFGDDWQKREMLLQKRQDCKRAYTDRQKEYCDARIRRERLAADIKCLAQQLSELRDSHENSFGADAEEIHRNVNTLQDQGRQLQEGLDRHCLEMKKLKDKRNRSYTLWIELADQHRELEGCQPEGIELQESFWVQPPSDEVPGDLRILDFVWVD